MSSKDQAGIPEVAREALKFEIGQAIEARDFERSFDGLAKVMGQIETGEMQDPRLVYAVCDQLVAAFGYDRTFDEFEQRFGEPDAPGAMAENFVYKQ